VGAWDHVSFLKVEHGAKHQSERRVADFAVKVFFFFTAKPLEALPEVVGWPDATSCLSSGI